MNGLSICLTAFALAGATCSWGQTPQRLSSGLEFKLPVGWQMTAGPDGAVIMPPDAVWAAPNDPSEIYIVAVLAGVKDVTDPGLAALVQRKYFANNRIQEAGRPRPFAAVTGGGLIHDFDAVENGMPIRIRLYVAGLPGGGVAALIAVGHRGLVENREAVLAAVAATLTNRAPALRPDENGPVAREWDGRFRGKKLVQLRGYNSGGGAGGYNGRKTLVLGADGTYSYQSAMAISVYTAGSSGTSTSRDNHSGRWRIYEQADRVLLETRNSNGDVIVRVLSYEGGKTFLDGERWFVVGINE